MTALVVISVVWYCANTALGDQRLCGATSLAACLDRLGLSASPKEISDNMPNTGDYASLKELAEAATRFGVTTRAIRWTDEIPAAAPPAIIAIAVPGDRQHFIAALESRGAQVLVRDGPHEAWVFTRELRRRGWDGTALHIARDEAGLAALVPRQWNSGRSLYVAAAGLFSTAGFIVWRSKRRKVLP